MGIKCCTVERRFLDVNVGFLQGFFCFCAIAAGVMLLMCLSGQPVSNMKG